MNIQNLMTDLIGESSSKPTTALPQCNTDPEKNSFVLKPFVSLLSSARSKGLDDPTNPNLARFLSPLAAHELSKSETNSSKPICSIPSLSLKQELKDTTGIRGLSPRDSASFMLAVPLYVDKSTIEGVPVRIIDNISQSISSLINSRLRSSVSAFIKRVYKRHRHLTNESSILIHLLNNSPLSLVTVVTSFRVLSTNNMNTNCFSSEVTLSLIFETVIDISIYGQLWTISFEAPGSVSGSFNCHDGLLEQVIVELDTIVLLQNMMKQARSCVKKIIAQGVNIAYTLAEEPYLHSLPGTISKSKLKGFSNSSLQALANQWKSSNIAHKTKNGSLSASASSSSIGKLNSPVSKSIQNESSKIDETYQLFAWLAGDKMMLDEETINPKELHKFESSE